MKKIKGFTLIELITVIAIIGILASVITISTTSARKQARDVQRKADLNSVSGALEMYYAQKKSYPIQNTLGGYDLYDSALKSTLTPTYISSLPEDPLNKDKNRYWYYSNKVGEKATQYYLDAQLESKEETEFTCDLNGPFQTGTCKFNDGSIHYRVTSK